ncbi:hypothetical protein EV189_0562 [Motilibacter rhizosphaerae]|uniref:TetR family transcriptional regulator n=1 Tax=Motilibacter rhizosphaerae TaxID=598652 RepID=A0A4Q7NVZ0_9ACTN|nr:hypothetical protein [Motilibacter rhizosphaerae]RZS91324.1 hypothetical protein EV189_0562 [Motilibacter rhizosphaerae]
MIEELQQVLTDRAVDPVDAALGLLEAEVDVLLSPSWATYLGSPLVCVARFGLLIRTTPALRAHERESLERVSEVLADALAQRGFDGPEGWVTATAITGLWPVFYRSLHREVQVEGANIDSVRSAVMSDVRRAAGRLRSGI